MLKSEVLKYLERYQGEPLKVRVYYVDRSHGETSGNYYVAGNRSDFESITEFAAQGLIGMDQHNSVYEPERYPEGAWSNLVVESTQPESWMAHYNAAVIPGQSLCFPPVSVLRFEPPANLQHKLTLITHPDLVEECLVCENAEQYVLLYWYTTG